jgi:hypothetical protein
VKTTFNILLTFLFVVFFLIGLVSATSKFQLLTPGFWEKTLENQGAYPKVATILKTNVEDQITKEGGRKSDIKILTDIITPDSVRDFISKNLDNILGYANAQTNELLVYIPFNKIPKSFIPKNVLGTSEQVPLTTLLTKLNVTNITQEQFRWVSLVGKVNNYFFWLSAALAVLTLIVLFILVEKGKRFVAPGVALLVSGVLSLLLFGASSNSQFVNLIPWSNLAQAIVSPILSEISRTWLYVGVTLGALGIILFLFKKPTPKGV